jgi:dTDP-4-amino-4,6-dideoxygalactose transaminase
MQFLDLTAQYKSIKEEIDNAIKRVLDSGIFIGGSEVEEFEKEVAAFCGTKYAVGVNSGTDALFLSLKALGIRQGDEVIAPAFTFIATAEVIANCGAKPVFVDINPKTFNIDPSKIEEKITKNTKAIIPVHLFGQMADMDEIMEIAKKYKLYVIEDAAQAIGAEYKGKKAGLSAQAILAKAGTIGDLGCFSFFPSKNLGAYGDGGMVATDNEEFFQKIKLLKNHGSSPKEKYLNLIIGTNSRLDAIQAAILRVKLKYLSKWSKERAERANYYNKNLNGVGDIITPFTTGDRTHIFHQYTIRTKSREKLQKCLKEKGIPTMIYYPLPLHLQTAFKNLVYKEGDFPEAEKAAKEVLSLPLYPEISQREQGFILEEIKNFYRNYGQ